MIRVLLVHNHDPTWDGLPEILEAASDIQVVGEVTGLDEMFTNAVQKDPDIIVMDLDTPGLDATIAVKRPYPPHVEIPVIILTSHPESVDVGRLLRAGARGYVATQAPSAALIDAVRTVHGGDRYVCRFLENAIARNCFEVTPARKRISRLTARERMVFRLLAVGETTRQVAEDLGVSRKTVSTHRSHVLVKLGLRNNAELARFATENDLIRH